MNIVITGSTGFLGRHLIKYLSLKKKNNLICIVRPNSDCSFFKNLNVDIIEWDFSKETISHKINKNIDVLIHLAGILPGQKNTQVFKENVAITKKLLCSFNKINHIIFSSTNIVNLKNNYSESKLECEELIKKSGINYTILRIGPTFGKDGITGSASKIIDLINKEKFFPIPKNSKIKIQPIHIDDVIKFIEKVILNKNYHNMTCNVVGDSISLIDFAKVVSIILKKPNKSIQIPFFLLNFLVTLNELISKKPIITSEQLNILKDNENSILESDISPTPLELSLSKFNIK